MDGFRAVRQNTVRIAEDIPESQYDYRPTPQSRSVAETLVHIAWLWMSVNRFEMLLGTKEHEMQHRAQLTGCVGQADDQPTR